MAGVSAHGGVETTASPRKGSPGYLKWYWTKGEGRAKWNTWRELRAHLIKFMSPAMADRVTSVWYHDATGVWSGSDLNRVRHGKPPRGKVVGPG
jgi:hypothetical protein